LASVAAFLDREKMRSCGLDGRRRRSRSDYRRQQPVEGAPTAWLHPIRRQLPKFLASATDPKAQDQSSRSEREDEIFEW